MSSPNNNEKRDITIAERLSNHITLLTKNFSDNIKKTVVNANTLQLRHTPAKSIQVLKEELKKLRSQYQAKQNLSNKFSAIQPRPLRDQLPLRRRRMMRR